MKTIFKSMLLTVLVMGLATAAMAQGTGATTTINVTARVLKPITLGVPVNINFGGVFAGTAPFLDPKGAATANVGFAAAIGSVVVDATAEEPIRVEFDTVQLVNVAGTQRIAFIPIISAFSTDEVITATNRASSLLLGITNPTGGVVTDAGTGTGPFGIIATSATVNPVNSLADRATLLIGGRLGDVTSTPGSHVNIGTGQQTGTYTATLRLNLLYAL